MNQKPLPEMVYEILRQRRSVRRFSQKTIPQSILTQCVDVGRLAPSGANLQPLFFIIVNDRNLCKELFETIGWAAYITPKWVPKESERPVAYIALGIKEDQSAWAIRDVSFAAAQITVLAAAYGIGSCVLCNIDKKAIQRILKIPMGNTIDSLIALGYPQEQPIIDTLTDDVKYWRDASDVLHVPKRTLDSVIFYNAYD